MRRTITTLLALGGLLCAAPAGASTLPPFPPASATGVPQGDIRAFAKELLFFDPAARAEGNLNAFNALGPADGATVSLGDLTDEELAEGRSPGVITVGFTDRVFNGPGADLAVFENASGFFGTFTGSFTFAELAYVEVSTNGADFARFPSASLNIEPDPATDPDDPRELQAPFGRDFAGLNTAFVRNLAGVHPVGVGTPFDLEELAGDPLVTGGLVDLDDIRFVRIVDIPGTGGFFDSDNNPILDSSVTTALFPGFPPTEGFDLDAVGALNATPEPSSLVLLLLAAAGIGPRRRSA